MKKQLVSFILFLIFSVGCGKKTDNVNRPISEIQKPKDSVKSVLGKEPDKTLQYSIEVDKIDSLDYRHFAIKNNLHQKKTKKITDFKEAKKLLKGIVEFDENPDYGDNPAVKRIHYRTGKTKNYDYSFFIAYYPEEDILLCEGGHTTDISFDLKNGNETEETGNPDYINFSPNEKFRLNGHFGGQECSAYFIQKKMGNNYVKIIQLDEEFEKLTKVWLCVISESFWTDDNTLYLTEGSNFEGPKKYFKVKIIEK